MLIAIIGDSYQVVKNEIDKLPHKLPKIRPNHRHDHDHEHVTMLGRLRNAAKALQEKIGDEFRKLMDPSAMGRNRGGLERLNVELGIASPAPRRRGATISLDDDVQRLSLLNDVSHTSREVSLSPQHVDDTTTDGDAKTTEQVDPQLLVSRRIDSAGDRTGWTGGTRGVGHGNGEAENGDMVRFRLDPTVTQPSETEQSPLLNGDHDNTSSIRRNRTSRLLSADFGVC
mmetsp:Transcript_64594/g.152799  ORF Transcript_64594/g.152799 Transcript_64594/m.152799 type:complete len:228 (-) Transcript_64594:26-709(-)